MKILRCAIAYCCILASLVRQKGEPMRLDAALRNYELRAVPENARKMEALGYGCLWSSETQHDPFLPLAAAATATSSIKLGTSIAVAFPRSPMVLAYTAWDIQKAS